MYVRVLASARQEHGSVIDEQRGALSVAAIKGGFYMTTIHH
jgi:hypothetical protein